MDLLFAFIISFGLLVYNAAQGSFIGYPLLVSWGIFLIVFQRRGFAFKDLLKMSYQGSQKAFPVLLILLLIGVVISTWMAAGTVPALVFYGLQLVQPQLFVLSAFLLSSIVSLLIGTSFGTAGTIGIAIMIMARGSEVNPSLIAGAIIAGAYFGDRCSPMSSSAVLIASITRTNLYTNIKNMLITAAIPFAIACLIYGGLSLTHPVQTNSQNLSLEIDRVFQINPVLLLPALALIILSILRIEVKISMLVSVLMSSAIAVFLQQASGFDLLKYALFGFRLAPQAIDSSLLSEIMTGGGVISMAKVSLIVLISTALAGVLAATRALKIVEQQLKKVKFRSSLFLSTILIGTAAAAFGCTQTIAILLTHQLIEKKYEENQLNDYNLAIDLENTVVVISPLIPWNIAGFIPAAILMTGAGFIPYAVYLYLIPLCGWTQMKVYESFQKSPCN